MDTLKQIIEENGSRDAVITKVVSFKEGHPTEFDKQGKETKPFVISTAVVELTIADNPNVFKTEVMLTAFYKPKEGMAVHLSVGEQNNPKGLVRMQTR